MESDTDTPTPPVTKSPRVISPDPVESLRAWVTSLIAALGAIEVRITAYPDKTGAVVSLIAADAVLARRAATLIFHADDPIDAHRWRFGGVGPDLEHNTQTVTLHVQPLA